MPMIRLTVPPGTLPSDSQLATTLARTLMSWEGVPDTDFFRAQTWWQIDEVADFRALGDDAARFRVDVTVPVGALSARRRAGLIEDVTAQVLAAVGLDQTHAARVWVLIHEQPEGTWGAAGAVVQFAELRALAQQSHA